MTLNGIDIASYQAKLNAQTIPGDFVIVKATEGTSYVNPYCDRHFQQAVKGGKLVGVYHFANGKSSGQAEADFFLKNIKGYIGKAILVLDWEANAIKKGVGYAKDFLDRVKEKTGIKPLIYMSASVTKAYNWSNVVKSDYGLWVAAYPTNAAMGYKPTMPTPRVGHWTTVALYQYTSNGRLSGYDGRLDLDVFYGDKSAWSKYAGASNQATTPQTTQPQQSEHKLQSATKTPSKTPPKTTSYKIKKGDTLSAIAQRYGTTVAAIMKLNPAIKNKDKIYTGDTIRVK